MNNELKKELDEFIELFLNQKIVVQYLKVKKELEESKEISSLQKKLNDSKKALALSYGKVGYHQNKEAYLSLQEQYDNHPLVVNYQVLKEEVSYLLEQLEMKLKNI